MATTPLVSVTQRRPGQGEETGWVKRLFDNRADSSEYQQFKSEIHRKLLDRINLEAVSSIPNERVRAQVRGAVAQLVEGESTPLSLVEKDRVIEEVLDEVFGLVLTCESKAFNCKMSVWQDRQR